MLPSHWRVLRCHSELSPHFIAAFAGSILALNGETAVDRNSRCTLPRRNMGLTPMVICSRVKAPPRRRSEGKRIVMDTQKQMRPYLIIRALFINQSRSPLSNCKRTLLEAPRRGCMGQRMDGPSDHPHRDHQRVSHRRRSRQKGPDISVWLEAKVAVHPAGPWRQAAGACSSSG